MRTIFLFSLIFFGLANLAQAFDDATLAAFKPGFGSKYIFTMQGGQSADLVILVVPAPKRKIAIETYFSSTTSVIPVELWQQFVLEKQTSLQVSEGYIYAKELEHPEKLTAEYLKGAQGAELSDFLFADAKALEKNRVASEMIAVPAGKIMATRYKQEKQGVAFTYWISDEVKPLGLVKLEAKGPKTEQNYSLVLASLVSNAVRKIDPSKARPLSQKGKALIATPDKH